jgi:hypothetical protein
VTLVTGRPTRSSRYDSRKSGPTPRRRRVSRHQTNVANSRSFATVRDRGVSRCVACCRSNGVSRWARNNVGPVTMSHPESRSRCGSAPKAPSAKATSHRTNRQRMRSAPQALDSHPPRPTCRSARAPRLVPGCGRRPAGAVRHPSVIDSEWTRVRCAIRSVDGRAQSRDRRSPQRTWMTGRRWPAIRGPGDG